MRTSEFHKQESRPSVTVFFAFFALSAVIVLGGVVAGCEDENAGCVVGSERCGCINRTSCATGLSCFSGLCVRPTTVPGLAGSDQGPPNPDQTSNVATSDAGAKDAGNVGNSGTPQPRDASLVDLGPVPPMSRPDSGGSDGGGPVPGPSAEWTIFVYGHGDHNLTPSLLRDVQEMSRARLNENVQVILLVDWNSKTKLMNETFPKGAFWYRILGNGSPAKLITEGPELDLDDPSVLAAAMRTAFKSYPAKRYGAILWDHGGAWQSGFGGDTQDGERRPLGMAVTSIVNGLRLGVEGAGLTAERPLDFLAFDTCLMAGAEVLGPLAPFAKIYIANAELDFGDGLDYTETLSWLSANPGASVVDFARAEAGHWDAHHKKAGGLDLLFRSHVAIDTTKYAPFATAMKAVTDSLQAADGSSIAARSMYESFPAYFAGVTQGGIPLRDAGNLLERLKASDNTAIAAAAAKALEAAMATRVAVAAGTLREGQLGIHIYGGSVGKLDPATNASYLRLANTWEQQTGWGALLTKLKTSAPKSLAPIMTVANAPAVPTPDAPAFLDIESPGPDTAFIEGILIKIDPTAAPEGLATSLGTIAHGFVKTGSARLRWEGDGLALRVTSKNLPVAASPWVFTAQGQMFKTPYLAVIGALRVQDEEYIAGLLMDASTLLASHMVVAVGGGHTTVMSIAKATAVMGEKPSFFPMRITVDIGKGTSSTAPDASGIYLPSSGVVGFVREPVPPGTYVLSAAVEDFWGNSQTGGQVIEVGTKTPQ